MQKKFIANLILVLMLNVIVKPFYILGIDAEILKQTGADYGIYFSLLGLTFILNIFLDAGIVNYNVKNIAQHKQLLHKHFSGIITIRLGLSFIYFGLIYLVAWLLNYPSDYYFLLGILAFNQVLVAFILYLRSNLSGLLLFKQDSFISVLDRGILIILLSYLLWWRTNEAKFQIEWFAYAQSLAYAITLLTALFLVIKQTGKVSFRFNKVFSIAIIRHSLPYATLILLMMIYYRSDAIMLERLLPNGKLETAIYAQGYRFFEAFNMLGFLFAGLLLPLFAKLLKEKKKVEDLLFTSFKILFSISLVLALAAYLNRTEIIAWRYGVEGTLLVESANSFGVLMLCFVAVSTTYIFGTLLTANGNLKRLNKLALGGVFLNLVLNYFLIPKLGAYGASWASLITQVITVLGQIILVFNLLKIKGIKAVLVSTSMFTFSLLIGFYTFDKYLDLNWFLKFITFGFFGLILSLVTKMIDVKHFLFIMKEEK